MGIPRRAQSEQPNPKRWLILASVGVGTIMSTIDGSVVNISMPTITTFFHTTIPISQWVATAYLLTISSLLLTYGRAGDIFGHRRIYLMGFGLFTAASLLCGISPSIGALIAFRVLQALGAGMLMASGPALVTSVFPPSERGRALGANGMMVAVGLSLGPVLGGVLVETLGWRSIFYINLPIGIAGSIWAYSLLPKAESHGAPRKFDVAGGITACIALLSILMALSNGEEWGWFSPPFIGLLILGVAAFYAFLRVERSHADPMVDLGLFNDSNFSLANLTSLLNFMGQFSISFLTPFYLQRVLNLPPDKAGIVMLASPLVIILIAPLSGILSDRYGTRWLAGLGMALVTVALYAMSLLGPKASMTDVAWRLALIGLGSGIFQSPNNSIIMGSVPRSRLGLASGMLATMRNVGMVLGIALSSAIFTWQYSANMKAVHAGSMTSPTAYTGALHSAFLAGAVLALLGCITAVARGRMRTPGERAQG